MSVIKEIKDTKEKQHIARMILEDLPEWFGLKESREEYIDQCKEKMLIACFIHDQPVGFIVFQETSPHCAEIWVMGVKKDDHRRGWGKRLYQAFERAARERGYTYVQVKTVQSGRYDEYDCTNAFYQSVGFVELECFPTLWDEWNPCQVYVKYIGTC